MGEVVLVISGGAAPPAPFACQPPPLPALLLVSVAWPSLHLTSYARWRLPALSALRLLLFRWAGACARKGARRPGLQWARVYIQAWACGRPLM